MLEPMNVRDSFQLSELSPSVCARRSQLPHQREPRAYPGFRIPNFFLHIMHYKICRLMLRDISSCGFAGSLLYYTLLSFTILYFPLLYFTFLYFTLFKRVCIFRVYVNIFAVCVDINRVYVYIQFFVHKILIFKITIIARKNTLCLLLNQALKYI